MYRMKLQDFKAVTLFPPPSIDGEFVRYPETAAGGKRTCVLDFLRHVRALPRLSFTMPKGRIFPILAILPLCHVFSALKG